MFLCLSRSPRIGFIRAFSSESGYNEIGMVKKLRELFSLRFASKVTSCGAPPHV